MAVGDIDARGAKRQEILLWSSKANGKARTAMDGVGEIGHTWTGDSVELHGGENNGGAQCRLSPATGKYASLPGLSWMNDIRAYGVMWSQNPADSNVGGDSAGIIVDHDYGKGGPDSRLEHVHVIDCAGWDRLTLFWQAKCLAMEGLAQTAVTDPTTLIGFADGVTVMAAGMPAIDSSEPMFSIPKLMRLNETDSLASEGQATAFSTDTTLQKTPGSGNPRTIPYRWVGGNALNTEPEIFIESGAWLLASSHGTYPGTDTFIHYEMVRPSVGFGPLGAAMGSLPGNVCVGMRQWGQSSRAGVVQRNKMMQAGDKYEFQLRIGYPLNSGSPTAQAFGNGIRHNELYITGLARIALIIGSTAVGWGATPTFLASTPVGPAVAPRQHIRGRLWAILTAY